MLLWLGKLSISTVMPTAGVCRGAEFGSSVCI